MRLGPITYGDALYIAEHMREWDRREVFAGLWTDSPYEVVQHALLWKPGWTAYFGLKPIALVGAFPTHPGVWSVGMVATDEFPKIGKKLTRFVKRVMIPALVETGAHRAECCSMVGHEEAHRWLKLLGAHEEALHKGFGRGQEDFIRFVWDRANVLRPESPERQ